MIDRIRLLAVCSDVEEVLKNSSLAALVSEAGIDPRAAEYVAEHHALARALMLDGYTPLEAAAGMTRPLSPGAEGMIAPLAEAWQQGLVAGRRL